MEHSATSKFEYDMAMVMKKHGMNKSFMMYHPAETGPTACKVVYFNKPSLSWVLTSFENLGREIEHRKSKGMIMSAVPKMPNGPEDSDVQKLPKLPIGLIK